MRKKKVVCFIPARGGSNGIVGKNKLPVAGHPLVAWSIRQAVYLSNHWKLNNCEVVTVVSTDSPEIVTEARRYGSVEFSLRPKHLADNGSSLEEVVLDYLDREDGDADHVVLMQPTSPIRRRKTLDKFADMLFFFDSVVTYREGNPHTFRRVFNGFDRLFTKRHPRQDRPDEDRVFHDAGNLYGFSVEALKESGDRISGKTGFVEVSLFESLELDEIDELPLIEEAMRVLDMQIPEKGPSE